MELFLIKTDKGYFLPMYNSDREVADKIRVGEELKCKLVQPRNVEFHKKFMALINLGYENQDVYTSFERFRKDVVISAGFYYETMTSKGLVKEAQSISFTAMPETEFENLYNECVNVVGRVLDLTREEVMNELVSFM